MSKSLSGSIEGFSAESLQWAAVVSVIVVV